MNIMTEEYPVLVDKIMNFLEIERRYRKMSKVDFAKLCGASSTTYNWWRVKNLPSIRSLVLMKKNNINLVDYLSTL